MAAPIENAAAPPGESKSARKKAAKAAAASAGVAPAAPAVPTDAIKDNSVAADSDAATEHPYLRELQKHIRNISKKLSGSQKVDAIIAENSGLSLDELVAQRKINADQKAAALKKPQLQAQLAQLEEQVSQYRKIDTDYQTKLNKQREELTAAHQKELAELRSSTQQQATDVGASELRQKLLVFSQFLRLAAHKRSLEEDTDTEESRAFEGALLLVYGGDEKAVDTAVSLIEGSSEQVPSIEGSPTSITFAQIKQASTSHAPFQAEEAWIESVEEARGGQLAENAQGNNGSDPTIVNAGLTELSADNGLGAMQSSAQVATSDAVGNSAGERWDTNAPGTTAQGGLEESYEIIPRPSDDAAAAVPEANGVNGQKPQGLNWADEAPSYELAAGNQAAEAWDTKAPGEQSGQNWPTETAVPNGTAPAADDGFHEVAGRHRGRGGHRGRGDGEFRGRGGRRGNFRPRGDGEFRGGRGGRGGARGDGEFRGGRGGGRGGRGGPRGGSEAPRGGA